MGGLPESNSHCLAYEEVSQAAPNVGAKPFEIKTVSPSTTFTYWAKPITSPHAASTPGRLSISKIISSEIFSTSNWIGPCPPLPPVCSNGRSLTGETTRSTPSYIPENRLSNADLLLSEKIFEAIITATPRITEEVVSSILTG